jgi:small subunit ribosomal protein S6
MLTTSPGIRLARSARAICSFAACPEVALHEYELLVVMNPDIPEEDVTAAIDRVTGAITTRGGEIENVDAWGRRRLAYPIKRHIEGNYVLTNLRLDPSKAHELESSFLISEDILRHMLIRKDEA